MTSNSQTSINISDSAVIEHTRNEIKRVPKMKQEIAAQVARNLDELLKTLSSCGVPMHAICREVPLGNPDDRDSKALYKYRNPEGSKPRKYVTKSARYFDIAEAISRIPGHSLTGSSGELLRCVFEGTRYAPVESTSESVAIHLKKVLDRNVEKIAQHINLRDTFLQLANIRHGAQEHLQVIDQYQAAIYEEKYTRCVPQLEIGYIYQHICDDNGNYLYLESENDGNYWLAYQCQVSLFIGLDENSEPKPFLILKTKKGFHAIGDHTTISLEKYQDAPRTWGIMFYGTDQQRFLLGAQSFRRSVKFSEYDPLENKVQSAAAKAFYEEDLNSYGSKDIPFEHYLYDSTEFELDQQWEHYRCAANNEYLTEKFLNANPKFNSKYIEGKDSIDFRSITVNVLEHIEANIEKFGALTLGGENSTLSLPPNTPLLFGDGALGKLMGWFTGSAMLSLELDDSLRELVGDDLDNSDYSPPYGWYSSNLEQGSWSAADLLWLHTKIFATEIDALFQSTRPQQEQYEEFVEWLGND